MPLLLNFLLLQSSLDSASASSVEDEGLQEQHDSTQQEQLSPIQVKLMLEMINILSFSICQLIPFFQEETAHEEPIN